MNKPQCNSVYRLKKDYMTLTRSECGKLGAIASKETCNNAKIEREIKYNISPKICKNCLKPIPYSKRFGNVFCGHACCASFNNKKRKVEYSCLFCGKIVKYKRKYCNYKCYSNYYINEKAKKIESVGAFPIKKSGNNYTIRKYLVHKYGNKCSICLRTIWEGREIPIIVDHINGDSTDVRLDNLRLVCPNCDAQLPTYKGRNRGKGRFSRRKRYKDGLSY